MPQQKLKKKDNGKISTFPERYVFVCSEVMSTVKKNNSEIQPRHRLKSRPLLTGQLFPPLLGFSF